MGLEGDTYPYHSIMVVPPYPKRILSVLKMTKSHWVHLLSPTNEDVDEDQLWMSTAADIIEKITNVM